MDNRIIIGLGILAAGALGYLWYRSRPSPIYMPIGSGRPAVPRDASQQILGVISTLAPRSSLQTPQAWASVSSTPAMAGEYTVIKAPFAPGWAMMSDPLIQVPGTVPVTVPMDQSPAPIQNVVSPPNPNTGIYYV